MVLVELRQRRVVEPEFPFPLLVTTALSVKLSPGVRFPLGLLVGVLTTKSGAVAMMTVTVNSSSSVSVSDVPLAAMVPVPEAVTAVTRTLTDVFEATSGGLYVTELPDPLMLPPPLTTSHA